MLNKITNIKREKWNKNYLSLGIISIKVLYICKADYYNIILSIIGIIET